MRDLQSLLHTIFLRSPPNLFDEFLVEVQKWYELPAHTLTEMRERNNKKLRGDIFEDFCVLYLKFVKGYEHVWLLCELPEETLEFLKMRRQDMGIDIIVKTGGEFYAVQCKYKKRQSARNVLSWTALSTFYAMCLRTGPWAKYIVMTNCDYTRRQGPKTDKDLSICLKSFENITKEEWVKICDVKGLVLNQPAIKATVINEIVENLDPNSKEGLRNLRIAYFDKKFASDEVL